MKNKQKTNMTRREFVKTSVAIGAAAILPGREKLFAAGSDNIRIGLIGCGGRGTGAVLDCIQSSEGIELIALADIFEEKVQTALQKFKEQVPAEKMKLTSENCFVGFDAYEKLIATDVDLVLLATPPHFRPMHTAAAVEAGKQIFMEKPVAVDPVGVRSIIASSELAKQKGLAILAGTHRRHQNHYRETIKRVHDGDIGEIVAGQCYFLIHNTPWLGGHVKERQPQWSDMEYQCRTWYWYTWLSGDHNVEQHVHNLDVINWAIGTHPVKCIGLGGRQARTGPEYGNIYDHFTVEYEYPNDVRVQSMCRQVDECTNIIAERVIGTNGIAYTDESVGMIKGQNAYKYDGDSNNPYVTEHADLIASIRNGQPINEGRQVAESTLTAIMGRMSAYTGRAVSWDWVMNASKLDLSPPEYNFDIDLPVRPIAVPGETKLI
jgi:predicted dehydrogenase